MVNLLFFFFSIIPFFALAQSNLAGKVMNSRGQPISFASVLLMRSNNTIAFSSTDEEGSFLLKSNFQSTDSLTVRHLNFQTVTIPIPLNNSIGMKIIMDSSANLLADVNVSSTPYKNRKNDTTTFLVEHYKTPDVRQLEQLLKNIGSFNILDNGKILYNNRSINKVLIDGDDLTGSSYEVLTKNLGIKILEKLQVIDNYADNRIVGLMNKSGEQALNLITQDKVKLQTEFSASLGSSFFKQYQAGGTALFVAKKVKNFTNGNINNLNQYVGAENYWQSSEPLVSTDFSTPVLKQRNFSAQPFSIGIIPTQYFKGHRYSLASSVFNLHLNKYLNLQGMVGANTSRHGYNIFMLESILTDSLGLKTLETGRENQEKTKTGIAQFNLKIDDLKNFAGNISGSWNNNQSFSSFQEVSRYDLQQQAFVTADNSIFKEVALHFGGARLLNPGASLLLEANFAKHHTPINLISSHPSLIDFFNYDSMATFVNQHLGSKHTAYDVVGMLLRKTDNAYVKYFAGITQENQEMERIMGQKLANIPTSTSSNQRIFLGAQFQNQINLNSVVGVRAFLHQNVFANTTTLFRKYGYNINSTLSGKWSNSNRFTFSLGLHRNLASSEYYAIDTVFVAPYNILTAIQDPKMSTSQSAVLTWTHIGKLGFDVSMQLRNSASSLVPNYSIVRGVVISNFTYLIMNKALNYLLMVRNLSILCGLTFIMALHSK